MRVACVGARNLSQSELEKCSQLGYKLASEGATITTGGALGADLAFIQGACSAGGKVIVFLPWASYNSNILEEYPVDTVVLDRKSEKHQKWEKLASEVHPSWGRLGNDGKKFHARNVGIVLGETLEDVVSHVYAFPGADRLGGTGQAMRLAEYLGIPLTNMRL